MEMSAAGGGRGATARARPRHAAQSRVHMSPGTPCGDRRGPNPPRHSLSTRIATVGPGAEGFEIPGKQGKAT